MTYALGASRVPEMTGQELRDWRARVGLSQTQLARRLETTPTTISRWERDRNPIPPAIVILLGYIEREMREKPEHAC